MALKDDTKITLLAFKLTGMLVVALVIAASIDISHVTRTITRFL